MHAERHGFDVALLRLGIVYGASPVEHAGPQSQTVVDKFRRMAARGEPLTIDGGGRATIGVVHVADAARILLARGARSGVEAANVVAETITVADVAALAEGREPREMPGGRSPRRSRTSTASRSTFAREFLVTVRPATSAGAPRRCSAGAVTTS